MVNLENLNIKKLDLHGLKTLIKWAEFEGWNPGVFDAEVYYSTDPNGFYGFYLNGVLVAGGAIVSYNKEYGFMGLFIVQPELRGKGIGRKLWYLRRDLLIARLKKGASIGMDGVIDMQPFYKKGGFEIVFKDERYENRGKSLTVDLHIGPISEEDLPKIRQYDKHCFGFDRSKFLNPWINLPHNKTYAYKMGETIMGFAVVRKVIKGYKIGPLFADNPKIGEELYKACLNAVAGELLYIDIPLINKNAIALVKKYKATYVFECARMYYGKPPIMELDKIFGITTFELG